MRIFLGFVMLIIASGDGEITINGVLKENVLLPCSCHKRDLQKVFKWEMEEPNKTLVVKYERNESHPSGRYKDRAKIFVEDNSTNCSVFITNIKQEDQGKYKCIFQGKTYNSLFVNLKISEKSPQLKLDPDSHPPTGSSSSRSACFMTNFKIIPVVVVLGFSLMSEIFI